MFGYVKTARGEMRVWEYETYKAVYCSLCRRLGKTYGVFARLTLSYDFTFLAVLSMSLKPGVINFEKKRCAFNPIKKCKYCTDCHDELELASAAAMVMVYYKLLDNIDDSRGLKKIGYRALLPLYRQKNKKAARLYPEIETIVSDYISEQSRLEAAACHNLDAISEPTSKALGKIFAMCSSDPSEQRVLDRLGFCIGKWIYLLDAAADLERDLKKGDFNPLKHDFIEGSDPKEFAQKRVEPLLNSCISDAYLCFELLDIKKYKGIIENIICLGLDSTQRQIFNKGENKNEGSL